MLADDVLERSNVTTTADAESGSDMLVIGVINQKGGESKTTMAVNLAATMASLFAFLGRVLLLDIDPQKSASFWVNRAGDKAGFDFTASTDPAILAQVRSLKKYAVVIVDTPGSLEGAEVLRSVIPKCDLVLVPTQNSALSFQPLKRTAKLATELNVPYRVVIGRVDPRNADKDVEQARKLLGEMGLTYMSAFIREYKIHSEAPLQGKVVTNIGWGPSARRARDDFEKLAREVVATLGIKGTNHNRKG